LPYAHKLMHNNDITFLPFYCRESFFFLFPEREIAHDNANRQTIQAPHVRNEPSYANSRTRNSVFVLIDPGRGCIVDIVLKSLDVLTRDTRMRSDNSR